LRQRQALFLPAMFSAWAAINYPNETSTRACHRCALVTAANLCCKSRWLEQKRVEAV